jgi:site-specific recombinase XerD
VGSKPAGSPGRDAMPRRLALGCVPKNASHLVASKLKNAGLLKRILMRGSVNYQINKIFVESGIFCPGEKKHVAKEVARRANGSNTWADLGKELRIYSYRTAEMYKNTWHEFGRWAKEHIGVKDAERYTSEHIEEYLKNRVADGVKYSTFERECAALSKFENALNMWSDKHGRHNEYSFRDKIYEVKAEAREVLDRSLQSRAYEDPKSLIENIQNEMYRTVASIQYEGGARVNEVWQIEINDLRGMKLDPHTKEFMGFVEVTGKGGKEREIALSIDTYKQIENILQEKGNMEFDKNDYREALKKAALESSQDYTGSHGLRWNFARDRMEELSEKTDMTYEEKLQEISWEMGHERADITVHYLGK